MSNELYGLMFFVSSSNKGGWYCLSSFDGKLSSDASAKFYDLCNGTNAEIVAAAHYFGMHHKAFTLSHAKSSEEAITQALAQARKLPTRKPQRSHND